VGIKSASVLTNLMATGLALHPVRFERVGSRDSSEEPPVPKDGREDDWYHSAPLLTDLHDCGQFFELAVTHCTEPSPNDGKIEYRKCSVCGVATQEESTEYKKRLNYYRTRKLLPRLHVPPFDVFCSHVFWRGFVMSDRILSHFSRQQLKNCKMTSLSVIDNSVSF
jgi:hypothetical protein